ncbi:MAG TPA: MarR family transcriptional regulator [Anaerolineaceae bacterium]|nr:MarR family transcriptional regulator [Anaerolineaceae bacterium]
MPSHYQGNTQEIQALDTFIKLTRAVDSLYSRLARRGTLGDLTLSQFGVLETLYHLGSMSQSVICSKLLKSGGNMTLVVDNLEKHGLVQRNQDIEDRRITTVSLTSAGRDLIKEVLPVHVAAIVEEMNTISIEEQKTLGEICKKLGKKSSDD